MSVRLGQCKVVLIAAVVATSVLAWSVSSRAHDISSYGTFLHHHDDDDLSRDERLHIRADQLRRRVQENARSHLGYPEVYPFDFRRETDDYFELSQQISELTTLLNALEERTAAEQLGLMPLLDPAAKAGGGVIRLYGPEGPTPKSVRLLLEVRLMAAGNPRLKIGEITDQGDTVRAEVVTIDGSLVDAYLIDKTTGNWLPVR